MPQPTAAAADMNEVVNSFDRAVDVKLVHASPGRLRLKAEALKGDPAMLQELIDDLGRVQGITRVIGRPATGTLIAYYSGDIADVAGALVQSGRIKYSPASAKMPNIPVSLVGTLALGQSDDFISTKTNGLLDTKSSMAMVLLIAAVGQLFRGHIFGPTSTLLLGALSLLEAEAHRSEL